jgi:hypothetical protein
MMKKQLARFALRWNLARFLTDPNPFNRLLGEAIRLQLKRLTDEGFRHELDRFFMAADPSSLMKDLDFEAKKRRLDQPGGYKVAVVSLRSDPPNGGGTKGWRIWGRRFGLLNHLGVRCDVMVLRQGEQIPPHGHYRIVSGFYVLTGEVAIRHFDRVQEVGQEVLLRKVLDTTLGPAGFTTNSENHHNIHWLLGLAPVSYLFRVTVSGTPTQTFGGPDRQGERVYVDPTGPTDAGGLIRAPYITEQQAKKIAFTRQQEAALSAT